ncbi:MAG: hypothetical protein ACPGVO_23750, partial [Spirulinaceae cyanobacterium]
YIHIKKQFFFERFRPSELNAGRFSECTLRIVQFLDIGVYTDFDQSLNTNTIINHAESNTSLPQGIRFFIPRLTRVLLDIRNKRDVAHVGSEISPNYSDSLFVCHAADWILIELIRNYHTNSIDEARTIIDSISDTKIPIVADVDGFLRVQNTQLKTDQKTLILLYYKHPQKVSDKDLLAWLKYTNASRYRKEILKKLDSEALIHYQDGVCSLLPKGTIYIEKNIDFDLAL